MARAAAKTSAKISGGKPAPRRGLWVQGALCGATLTFAAPTALLLGVLLAPALACAAAEQGPHHGTTRAVTLCGLAACQHPAWRLWLGGDRMEACIGLLSEPATLVLAWGACACAWAACQVLPVLVRTLWDLSEAARGKAIAAELARYREDWDGI